MKKIVRLTESDLKRIANKVINEGMFGVETLKLEDEMSGLQRKLKTILEILGEMEYYSKKGSMSPNQYSELNFNLKHKVNMFNEDMGSIMSKVRKYGEYLMDTNK